MSQAYLSLLVSYFLILFLPPLSHLYTEVGLHSLASLKFLVWWVLTAVNVTSVERCDVCAVLLGVVGQ